MKELRVSQRNGEVIFSTRTWDGIDRPEHTEIDNVSVDGARHLIRMIEESIAAAEVFNEEARRKRIAALEAEIASKQRELDALLAKDQVELILDIPLPANDRVEEPISNHAPFKGRLSKTRYP